MWKNEFTRAATSTIQKRLYEEYMIGRAYRVHNRSVPGICNRGGLAHQVWHLGARFNWFTLLGLTLCASCPFKTRLHGGHGGCFTVIALSWRRSGPRRLPWQVRLLTVVGTLEILAQSRDLRGHQWRGNLLPTAVEAVRALLVLLPLLMLSSDCWDNNAAVECMVNCGYTTRHGQGRLTFRS
jgi:hypothetical protein